MKKSELLNWLKDENQQWDALLDQIGSGRMELPGVNGDWSFKDLLAHLTVWNRRLVAHIQAAQPPEPEPPPPWPVDLQNEDEINAWIYAANRERSLREILEETRLVNRQLLAVIDGITDDLRIEPARHLIWVGGTRFPAGEFFDHFHDDHETNVRHWLRKMEAK